MTFRLLPNPDVLSEIVETTFLLAVITYSHIRDIIKGGWLNSVFVCSTANIIMSKITLIITCYKNTIKTFKIKYYQYNAISMLSGRANLILLSIATASRSSAVCSPFANEPILGFFFFFTHSRIRTENHEFIPVLSHGDEIIRYPMPAEVTRAKPEVTYLHL